MLQDDVSARRRATAIIAAWRMPCIGSKLAEEKGGIIGSLSLGPG